MNSATVKAFLDWLDERTDAEPKFQHVDTGESGDPVSLVSYTDIPEPGFGWRSRWESRSLARPAILGPNSSCSLNHPTTGGCGHSPRPGEVIVMAEAMKPWFSMEGFVVWHMLALDSDDSLVHLPDGHLQLVQLVPLHGSELAHLKTARRVEKRDLLVHQLLSDIGDSIYNVEREPVR